jgi:ATP-dependent Lon protease
MSSVKVLDFSNKNIEDTFDSLKKFLGPPIFDADLEERSRIQFPPGTVNILTVGDFVGHVMTVESVYDMSQPEKKGALTFSGNVKQVLGESVSIAKINAYRLLNSEQVKQASEKNIHVHFMHGAVPKDGPSAGISICLSFLSLVLQKPIPANIAFTGELSLNGEVCKIGGVGPKLIAAKTI